MIDCGEQIVCEETLATFRSPSTSSRVACETRTTVMGNGSAAHFPPRPNHSLPFLPFRKTILERAGSHRCENRSEKPFRHVRNTFVKHAIINYYES